MNLLKFLKAGFIWCGTLLALNSYGQTEWSLRIPLGTIPTQYNSSFAGSAGAPRINSVLIYHPKSYFGTSFQQMRTYYESQFGHYTSFDTFIPGLASGISVTAGFERFTSNFYKDASGKFLSVGIAPKISIKGKYTLSPSVDINLYSRKSQPIDNPVGSYNRVENRDLLRIRAGLLFNTPKFYLSYSVPFFSKHEYTFNGEEQLIKKRFISFLQLGYTFQRNSTSNFSFTPQVALSLKESEYPFNDYIGFESLNLTFRYKKYFAGISNTGFHLGLQNEKLRLMLSSSLGILGQRGTYTTGREFASNLSFRYIFQNSDNRHTPQIF